MDTGFYSGLGSYSLDARCEILAELGYDATYLTLWSQTAWADLGTLGTSAARCGLQVAAVNATAVLGDRAGQARIVHMIRTLAATRTVEIAIRDDATTDAEAEAMRFLEAALTAAQESDVRLLLYPHTYYWLHSVDDAVRLCEALGTPRLGLVFPAFHWYASGDDDLSGTLARAARHIGLVNVCGSRRQSGGYFPATIEPLDSGELDNFALLGALRAVGHTGTVGIQGYGIGGDAFEHFRRSIAALRSIQRRLDAHPDWARLRPDRA